MSIIEHFRIAGGRPAVFAVFLGFAAASLATAHGCTAGGEVEPPDEKDEDDKELPGDRDAGGDPVVDDELTAAIAPIDDGHLESLFALDGSTSVTSGRAVEYLWEVEAPEGAGCEGSLVNPSAPVTSFTPACRGPHTVTLTISFPDDSKSSQAEATFSVDNRVPVLSALTTDGAFLPGEAVIISATVTDEDDEDAPTCTARLADDSPGDPTGLVIPSEPSADCSFTITTPPRVDTWKVVVVANDGFDDSLPATVELKAGNDPPVITSLEVDEESVGYACAEGACAASAVRVTVAATDDSDDFEEMALELVDVTEGAPAGVTVTATPVDGSPGAFDVVVGRDDLGALAGSYTLEARVTEVTAGEDGPATVTQQVSFEVTNQPPVLGTVTADDVGHAYESDGDLYTATLTVTAAATDPEANALTTTIALVSCLGVPAGDAACGGAELSIEETAADGSLVLELETSDLSKLAGEYAFVITVTDPEGALVSDEPTIVVMNLPPVIATTFQSSVEQHYSGGAHSALTPLFHDPDGDPITINSLHVVCPDGSSVTTPGGSCDSDHVIAVDAGTGVLTVTGPASDLLGPYAIEAVLSDGAADGSLDTTLTITNSRPSVSRGAISASKTCAHTTTSGTTVRNASGCGYSFAGQAADENGDPLTFRAFMQRGSDYTATGSGFNGVAVPANGKFDFDFGLQTTFSNFVSKYQDQPDIVIEVKDPFGAIGTVAWSPRLGNNPPVYNWKNFQNKAGTGAPPDLHNDQQNFRLARKSYTHVCYMGECSSPPPPYEFQLVLAAEDPDGDPMEVKLDIACSDDVYFAGGGTATTARALPASGRLYMEIPGRLGQCTNTARYREWNINALPCLPIGCGFEFSFSCGLDGAGSVLTDGMKPINLGTNLNFNVDVDETPNAFGCN